jgi:rhamnulokinase
LAKICIAIDIGASSGRIIEGTLKENKIKIKEIYRFKNNMTLMDGHYYWNIDELFNEIIEGLKALAKEQVSIESIGIDTWAVDYALLDNKNNRISPVFAYRDHRTDMTMEELFKKMNPKVIYEKTGIQFQQFNTIYQLYEHAKAHKEIISRAETFLMVPDYLNFLLSGEKAVEFTNATSTQLLNVHNHRWDDDLINLTGLCKKVFPSIVKPGTILGTLTKKVKEETGLCDVKVIAPATHDTGSAVVSVPADSEDFAYISSGTWSLMGIESSTPICSEKAREFNFTNEGGAYDTYRVLKNITGLWLIQEVQRIYDNKYSFTDLVMLAEEAEPFKCLIKPNSSRFLNPENMIWEIQSFCKETKQHVPETPGEISRCIFESLAFLYKEVLLELRNVQDKAINKIHIIGGGSQNKFLNQLCATFTNCEVYAGPVEATAIGNLAVQFISLGEIESLEKARTIILKSFEIEKYVPQCSSEIERNWNEFRRLGYVR